MLSYQHIYHAGNFADVHKHMLLAAMLAYLVTKDKPLSYIETHAGRGAYDLQAPEAQQTGESLAGIKRFEPFLDPANPFRRALSEVRRRLGPESYPGSPSVAAALLRSDDAMHLAELHPQEAKALEQNMAGTGARLYRQDGFAMAHAITPPTPRRGLMLIDPSYEVKTDYDEIPRHIRKITRAWNVGIIALWYPLLRDSRHQPMLRSLQSSHPDALRHELGFPAAKKHHGMIGSGMFIIRPTFGLAQETDRLTELFARIRD